MAHDFLTKVYLLTDVPMTYGGENKLLFADAPAQWRYFESKKKVIANTNPVEYMVYTKQSYIRQHRGSMRIQASFQQCRDCNYLMYQNASYEDYWNYAYITSIQYVNDEVVEIFFIIDAIQTYMFKYDFEQCYIKRQHTISDGLYEHRMTENLNLGDEYVVNGRAGSYKLKPDQIVVLANFKLSYQTTHPTDETFSIDEYVQSHMPSYVKYRKVAWINGVFCPCTIFTVSLKNGNPSDIQDALDQMTIILHLITETEIICIYECCREFGDASSGNHIYIQTGLTSIWSNQGINTTTIDGYAPKNKKLFTSPYTCLRVHNFCGDVAFYNFEQWDSSQGRGNFGLWGVNFTIPTVTLAPENYNGVSANWVESITQTAFPDCAWGGDAFKAYWAQQQYSAPLSIGADILKFLQPSMPTELFKGAFAGGSTAGAGGAVAGLFMQEGTIKESQASKIAQDVCMVGDLKRAPVNSYGSTRNAPILSATNHIEFRFEQVSIKAPFAKMIDHYFHMYGYAINNVGTPNIHARQKWTFIQTDGCQIRGTYDEHGNKVAPPASFMVEIEQLYDSGLRFWYLADGGSGIFDDTGVGIYKSGDVLINNNPL